MSGDVRRFRPRRELPPGKLYVVLPGPVISRNDGQEHAISATQLMRLYDVDPSLCYVYSYAEWCRNQQMGAVGKGRHQALMSLIQLYPLYSGDYPLFRNPRR